MTQAKAMLDGARNNAAKVVIVFTDGVPTTSTDFDVTVADTAISVAQSMKAADVKTYTVGIFNGADPVELHGEKWDYTVFNDINCSGEVGSFWGGSWLAGLVGGNDFNDIDIAAGNRFLNYLSSNFSGATGIGLEWGNYNPSGHLGAGGNGYKITRNFDRTSSQYYLTAGDSTSLSEVFQTISESISTVNTAINESTVVQDVVTDYFDLPANTSDIHVYTANKTADGWSERSPAVGVNVSINGQAVAVTGYDYAEHYVSTTAKADSTYGQKLIIEFTVQPDTAAIANAVQFPIPTNTSAGMYLNSEAISTAEGKAFNYCGVKYDANGGTGTVPASVIQTTQNAITVAEETGPTKDGAVLLGFSTTQYKTNLTSAPAEGVVINSFTPVEAGITTLYAVWAADTNGDETPDYNEDLYSVTYTDGVDGEKVFENQVYDNLLSGTATPAFEGTPSREGYTFTGWSPEVAATVTGDMTYTAKYSLQGTTQGMYLTGEVPPVRFSM